MSREDEKHRGPEYVPAGPVRIGRPIDEDEIRRFTSRQLGAHLKRIEALEAALAKAILQCGVHGAQIASLQMSMPKGIGHASAPSGSPAK